MRDPWERLTGESSKAYAHFCLYRDMGKGRSLRKLLDDDKCTSKVRQLGRWSSRWRWVERVQAYDDDQRRKEQLENEDYRKTMNVRHRRTGAVALSKVAEWLQTVQGATFRPIEAARIMEAAAKLERLAVGEPTEIGKTEHAGSIAVTLDQSKVSSEELRAQAIKDMVAAGLSQESAALLVDHISGAKHDGQRTRDSANDERALPPMAEGEAEG